MQDSVCFENLRVTTNEPSPSGRHYQVISVPVAQVLECSRNTEDDSQRVFRTPFGLTSTGSKTWAMSSLARSRSECERFLRRCVPTAAQAVANLPTMPKFHAVPSSKPNRHKFIEEQQPNWWQLPKSLRERIFSSSEAQAFAKSLEATLPFARSIGKSIMFPELARSSIYHSGKDVAHQILVSYLFAAGAERWKPTAFDRVWGDCIAYFDPANSTVEYVLYAPIAFMSGIVRSVDLGDGLVIRRLPVSKIARLASLDSTIAGVSVYHRFTQWPVCFFTKRLKIKKHIVIRDSTNRAMLGGLAQWEWASRINEEVAILRSLFNETPAVPAYAFIRDAYPRDPGGGTSKDLPWRARWPRWLDAPTSRDVRTYSGRRAKFLALEGTPGWENVAASMRRFAIAWENEFRADILGDVVAALERLVVREKDKKSYRLRTRTAHSLEKLPTKRRAIVKDLTDAYDYRSQVFHGGFVLDNAMDLQTATRMKRAKGKGGNPFYDVNEVHRLIYKVSNYYRRMLQVMIDRGQCEIDWSGRGL